MDQEKIGKIIKDIRISNNLTQADLANKYNVTYQAVSKWENGKNIPDIAILKQISKDFNIDINDLLDGNKTKNNKKYIFIGIIIFLIITFTIVIFTHNDNFIFKMLGTTCDNFIVNGSISYNKDKSSIYGKMVTYKIPLTLTSCPK